MEWWQSLLIALIPSILTASITLTVALVQIRRAKMEIKTRYESDKKHHITNMQFETEFTIYKELSEKIVSLVTLCLDATFNSDFDYAQIGTPPQKSDAEIFQYLITTFKDANETINKYAVFIPKKWYEKFERLKSLCGKQIKAFDDYVLQRNAKNASIEVIRKEGNKRHDDIEALFSDLVDQLRDYISHLDDEPTEKI